MTRGKRGDLTKEMFIDADGQLKIFEKSLEQEIDEGKHKEVECLGMIFPNDEARRKYFLDKLREKLKDPEFRKIEGFPIGTDEDILSLSDPPYYTACPNPFIADFIKHYGKPYDPATDNYRREPFATDVSEGKNDPIYNAHSYHTKVPHKAIMRYILHYTEPGNIVFDGFSGTGMTGVAAQMCGNKAAVESLGYRVDEDGTISQQETDESGNTAWKPFSKLGGRRALLNDLSPAATFIAYNYNTPVDVNAFEREAKRILKEVDDECGGMYLTLHKPTLLQIEKAKILLESDKDILSSSIKDFPKGKINYTVWSEFIRCSSCGNEELYWLLVVDEKTRYKKSISESIQCPRCHSMAPFREWEKVLVTTYDELLGKTVTQPKQAPVLINYTYGHQKHEKLPDDFDIAVAHCITSSAINKWFPVHPMLFKGEKWGDTWRSGVHTGLEYTHHFYSARSLKLVSTLIEKVKKTDKSVRDALLFWIQSVGLGFTKLNRYLEASYSQVNRYLKGTMYVARFTTDVSAAYALNGKIKSMKNALAIGGECLTTTQSASSRIGKKDSLDYVFVDPPFGGNLMYSELNFLWEAWLSIFTNSDKEAIESESQNKGLPQYQRIMTDCFSEFYSLLKPNRWMTLEFHNSKNSVWNCIQEAIQRAGFVIADVRVLDKKQLTMQQMTSRGAVKQDLVISAYKPNNGLEERFKLEAGREDGVWDFVRTHLKQLPVFVSKDGQAEVIAERQNYLLFDRMVAFHVQRGVTMPLSAAEFYSGLSERFSERDSMYFLHEQVAEYDKKRMTVQEVLQLKLFVTDESSAIQWLKQQLIRKPQTFQELHPQFIKEIGGWQKHEKTLELSELLEQNFLRYDGKGDVPSQIHTYLSTNFKELRRLSKSSSSLQSKAKDRWYVPDPNKAGDLEKLRERTLLREFEEYRGSKQRKLKVFRLEAVRAGFKKAWQERDYATIITVAGKIPETILQEDPKLLMWYDQAMTRTGG